SLLLGVADDAVVIRVERVELRHARRAELVRGNLAVVILVELPEEIGAVGAGRRSLRRGGHELGLAELPVMIGVELVELAVEPLANRPNPLLEDLQLGRRDLGLAEDAVAV